MKNSKIINGSLTAFILDLLESNGKMHGYALTKAVREASNEKTAITEAALYPTLHKLENEGKLSAESVIVDGRVRKYYKICDSGNEGKRSRTNKLEETISVLEQIFHYKLKNA